MPSRAVPCRAGPVILCSVNAVLEGHKPGKELENQVNKYKQVFNTAFTLPLGAVPARHRLSKIVRVNATKAVPCRARVSGAVPVLTRLLKRAGSARHWPGTNFLVV